MRLTTVGRYSTLGVYVTYRLEGTGELLWKAPQMMLLPPNSEVGHLKDGDEVETWYKIESYKAEFDRDAPSEYGEPPQQSPRDKSYFGVCCLVSLILP
ncbi:hypothetical protein LCGC14_1074820 [marine sediment metagenome]|uniref:Uncharacterized protein n=1 Tax=marine sediment metagenome TaxID=412755 RepID=A0A0F9MGZ1_9ZZZZ